MFVMLDVFSGRPNPTWELSPQLQSEFLKKISELGTVEKVQKGNGLGYRGLIVEEKVNPGTEERRLEVNNGAIQVFEGNLGDNASFSYQPSIAVNGDIVYVVWHEDPLGKKTTANLIIFNCITYVSFISII